MVVFAGKKFVTELCVHSFLACFIIFLFFLSAGMSKFSGKDQMRYMSAYVVSITMILVKSYNNCP